MKILILGGTKYLGLETANLLVDSGHKVTVVSRKKVNNHHISYEECDRKNLTKLKKVIVKIKPDFILDMICFDKKDAISSSSPDGLSIFTKSQNVLINLCLFIIFIFSN